MATSILPIVLTALYVLAAFLCFWAASNKYREENRKIRRIRAYQRQCPEKIAKIFLAQIEYRNAKALRVTALASGALFLAFAIYIELVVMSPVFNIFDEIKKLCF